MELKTLKLKQQKGHQENTKQIWSKKEGQFQLNAIYLACQQQQVSNIHMQRRSKSIE